MHADRRLLEAFEAVPPPEPTVCRVHVSRARSYTCERSGPDQSVPSYRIMGRPPTGSWVALLPDHGSPSTGDRLALLPDHGSPAYRITGRPLTGSWVALLPDHGSPSTGDRLALRARASRDPAGSRVVIRLRATRSPGGGDAITGGGQRDHRRGATRSPKGADSTKILMTPIRQKWSALIWLVTPSRGQLPAAGCKRNPAGQSSGCTRTRRVLLAPKAMP